MRTKTKIILGLVLALPVFYGIAFVIAFTWHAIDPEGQKKYYDEKDARVIERRQADDIEKFEKGELPWQIREQAEEQKNREETLANSSETKYENMVLNYKGKDGKGFSIEDFANAGCLKDQQGSSAQYMDDNFDDKSGYHSILVHTPVNINLNPPCLGGGWWFGVNNQGNVITWEYDGAADVLDYLDNQG